LEVAKVAFTRLGAGASLDDVVRRAGVSAGTLYCHFPAREELLKTACRTEIEKLAAEEQPGAQRCGYSARRPWLATAMSKSTPTPFDIVAADLRNSPLFSVNLAQE
jgi:AcrR family transcriptional regulator